MTLHLAFWSSRAKDPASELWHWVCVEPTCPGEGLVTSSPNQFASLQAALDHIDAMAHEGAS